MCIRQMSTLASRVHGRRRFTPFLFLTLTTCLTSASAQTYEDAQSLLDNKLSSSVYRTDVRPILDQSKALVVNVSFELISIVEVNDVSQTFICNGFLSLLWRDERLRWNQSEFGNFSAFNPHPVDIWRPRLLLVNTVGKRDVFEDDFATVKVTSDGGVFYTPGSVFSVTCALDLRKFPFDRQTCDIHMIPAESSAQVMFQYSAFVSEDGLAGFIENSEWEVNSVKTVIASTRNFVNNVFCRISITRRATFLVLNIILPVLLLSFLNILVFLIPADSGEKISYCITVLMTLTVFLSITSAMLPRAAQNIPMVTVYLACVLIGSVLNMLVCLFTVYLKHLDSGDGQTTGEKHEQKRGQLQNIAAPLNNQVISNPNDISLGSRLATQDQTLNHSNTSNRIASLIPTVESLPDNELNDISEENTGVKETYRFGALAKHIDKIAFVVYFVGWIFLTGFFIIYIIT